MNRLRSLQYFVEAARAHSFSGASRTLGVTVPAVTKGISLLEHELGLVLFERTSRGLTLTSGGAAYLEACLPALAQLDEADAHARAGRHALAGTVVVGVHNIVARNALAAALPRFHAQLPGIQLDLRDIDHQDSARTEGIDVFLTMGWGSAPDLVHRKVATAEFWLLASPQYLARFGAPQHPNALSQHNCLLLRNTSGKVMDLWEYTRGAERVSVVARGWLLVSNVHRDTYVDALLAGEGIARSTDWAAAPLVAAGRLVRLLPEWVSTDAPPISVLYRAHAARVPRVRAVIDFAIDLLGAIDRRRDRPLQASATPEWMRRGYPRASSFVSGPRSSS